jgi:hypothetical protein
MLKYRWLIVLVVAAVVLSSAWADEQHALVPAGDPRGTYGVEIRCH